MCDNCKWACLDCEIKQRAINEQKRSIDDLDMAIGRQQTTIGELQTELAAKDREITRLRGMVGRGGKLVEPLRDMLGGA